MNSSPFEAPSADHDPHAFAWLVVPAAWGLAGGACGTALGLTVQLTQAVSGAAASGGLAAAAGGALLGAVALIIERRSSLSRPELVDGRGTRSRPLHGAVLFLPVLVAFPSLLWLVFAGSIGVDSLLPAVAFGMIAVVVAVAGVRVLLVWRRDGEQAAREVAEHLFGPQATALHRALLARLREKAGELDEARGLRGAEVRQLLSGGLGQAIHELR
jgi:hypothetical protein